VLAYVPFLVSDPGRVSADSKQDLFLDPGGLLARAVDLWDPSVGAGTVPHQGLGYLFPTAPWFWAFDRLGVPDWVAQRLWWGTLTLAALQGARWLLRRLGTGPTAAMAGALVYGLTPYQLAFTARMSVLLLPWAALPWLVGLAATATRRRGWRWPAILALTLALVGGVNASSLLLVAVAPALWVLLELWRRPERAAVLAASARVGVLAVGISAWWVAGLWVQGTHGLPVLQLTEDVRTVAAWSAPDDVLRGLGNWFFYGRDRTGWSLDQAEPYVSGRLVEVVTFALPAFALGAAVVLRWAHRAYFGLLVVVGTILAVGAWPVEDPTPWGRAWRTFADETSVGLAFRNSPRAVPVVVLGLAGLLAGAIDAIPPDRRRALAAGSVGALAVLGLLPVWQTGYLTDGMQRPEDIPAHWLDAAEALDAEGTDTRVLEVPGSSFAAYTWGTTVDPVTPGLTERPYLAREVLPAGSPGTVDLLDALDRRFQLGIAEPSALAPLARLLGVGTIVFRGDLEQAGRFDTPPAEDVWEVLQPAPPGLSDPTLHGVGEGAVPGVPAVARFAVEDPRTVVRTAPGAGGVLLAGDGDGIVDSAAAGLLDGRSLVLASSALDDEALEAALDGGADLIVTDTNRRRIETWFYSIRDTKGPTERAGEVAADPTGYDFRLDPFPGTGDDHRSVVEHVGGTVEGTGGRGPEAPEHRASQAVDGDRTTAWRVAGPDVGGHHLTLTFGEPVPAGEVRILRAPVADGARQLARVRVHVDDRPPVEVDLSAPADADGQLVDIDPGPVRQVRIELVAVGPGRPEPVGLAEVAVGSAEVAETVRLPVDLLDRAGSGARDRHLDLVLTRLRTGPGVGDRTDEEGRIDRRFSLPAPRSFALRAEVQVSAGDDLGEVCRDDLVQVDGVAVPVRPSADPAGDPSHLLLEGCGPVDLAAGAHRVVTATVGDGLAIDRIVLSSDPSGEPAPVGPRGGSGEAPRIEVTAAGSDHVRARVGGADDPFWLVLAQSHSSGWSVRAEGAEVGSHEVVDGYANGWRITPSTDTVELTLRWTPQRLVWIGLGISGLTAIAAAVLVWGPRRRADDGGTDDGLADVARLAWTVPPGPRAQDVGPVLVMIGTAVVGVLVAPLPVAALGTAVAALVALAGPLHWVLAFVPAVALVAARVLERPSAAWVAVLLLVAELLRELGSVSRRATR
jgi:arabinofuranan 3-O-arabinosyltransferase